jgi:hypothetical protein
MSSLGLLRGLTPEAAATDKAVCFGPRNHAIGLLRGLTPDMSERDGA